MPPPGEIIEVSWRKPLAQLIVDLKEVKGQPEMDLVCQCLLGRVSRTMDCTHDSLDRAVRQARGIAQAAGDSDLCHIFDVIEDRLRLAEMQVFGTVDACRKDFDKALKEYSMIRSPLTSGHTPIKMQLHL